MNISMKRLFIAPLLCLSLISLGCSVSNLIVLLDGVSAATEAAIPLLSTSGVLSPTEAAAVAGYLNVAVTNIPQAVTIIENAPNGNVAAVASQVISLLNAIATAPQLSAAVPAKDAGIVNAVALSAQAFLAALQQQTAGLHLSHPELVAAFTGGSATGPVKLSRADKSRLKQIRERMEKARKALAAQRGGK